MIQSELAIIIKRILFSRCRFYLIVYFDVYIYYRSTFSMLEPSFGSRIFFFVSLLLAQS